MNRKVYVASRLTNCDQVISIQNKLKEVGIEPSYDWATYYKNFGQNPKPQIELSGQIQGVKNCHCAIFLLPGGRGTHIEMGMAYAYDKPIVIHKPEDVDSVLFYTHPKLVVKLTLEVVILHAIKLCFSSD